MILTCRTLKGLSVRAAWGDDIVWSPAKVTKNKKAAVGVRSPPLVTDIEGEWQYTKYLAACVLKTSNSNAVPHPPSRDRACSRRKVHHSRTVLASKTEWRQAWLLCDCIYSRGLSLRDCGAFGAMQGGECRGIMQHSSR